MNTKRIKELAALTDGELARKLLIQEFGNDSEAHWGNNAHDERVMVTISPDGIAQRTWEADHWVRLDEFDKDGFYAREIYEGKWVDGRLTGLAVLQEWSGEGSDESLIAAKYIVF